MKKTFTNQVAIVERSGLGRIGPAGVSRAVRALFLVLILSWGCAAAQAQMQMEKLDRGVVAVSQPEGKVFVSWRMFGTEPNEIAFNVYRNGEKINEAPITNSTNFVDAAGGTTATYYVRALLDGVEQAPSKAVPVWGQQFLTVPIQRPAGGTTPAGEAYTYSANDMSVGDMDGDGEYEIVVKWDPSNAKDNSQSGYTGNVYLDAYKLNGTRLWRIDLGRNIRAGAHYTQFLVYDLDGDGKAEVACKTADATIDGAGVVIGNAAADFRTTNGYVLSGPEFLTVFNGETGKAMATTDYLPARGTVSSWGDNYGNRVDRFVAAVAYLDGQRPSLIMGRGYYTRLVRVAYDWHDGKLTHRWTFDSNTSGNGSYAGQGNHQMTVGDMDGDGKQEISNGSSTINDDGTGLWNNRLGHGDALHMSNMDPDRAGQEIFMPYESPSSNGGVGMALLDARTGVPIWSFPLSSGDIGRGMAADIDPRHKGYEMWASGPTGGVRNVKGEQITASAQPSINFGIWWDGDLMRELLDGSNVTKWNHETSSTSLLANFFTIGRAASNNGTKATPGLSADIFGDWREEAVFRTSDNNSLVIFTTTIPTEHRIYTLMHDPQYRVAIAWQNSSYNQPPHPGFYLGTDMEAPPKPNIVLLEPITLPNRSYLIKPVHSDLCLQAGEQVSQEACADGANQVWRLQANAEGLYSISSLSKNQYLGYAATTAGSGLTFTGEAGQGLFKMVKGEHDTFTIFPATTEAVSLAVDAASLAPGQQLVWAATASADHQRFTFTAAEDRTDCTGVWGGSAYLDACEDCVGGNTGKTACSDCNGVVGGSAVVDACGTCTGGNTGLKACKPVAEGMYVIKPVHANLCLEPGQTLLQQTCTDAADQVFWIRPNGNFFEVQSVSTGKFLHYTSTANNTDITFADTPTGGLFRLEDAGDGAYHFVPSTAPGFFMDVTGRSVVAGAKIILYVRGSGTNQMFRLIPSTITSLGKETQQKVVAVYPNPSRTSFQIQTTGPFNYEVIDQVGRVVETGEGTHQLAVGEKLRTGLYTLKVKTAQTNSVTRLLKI